MTSPTRLPAQTAVVTGASRGIGRAVALRLAAKGARVVLGARSISAVEEVAGEIRSAGGEAIAVEVDVTSQRDNERLARMAAETFGSLDVLVANAGVESSDTILRSDPAEWINTINTNLVGSYLSARAALPAMKEQQSGQILFVGSGVGHSRVLGRSAYGASKSGVSYLSAVLAQEVWRYGVSVNEVIPGPVATDMTSSRWSLGEAPPELPSERVKSVEEVAAFVETILHLGTTGPTGQVFSLARRPL